MATAPSLSPEQIQVISEGVRQAWPFGTKVAFMNCEFHETEGGMSWSDDLFAVVKHPLVKAKRVRLELSPDRQLQLMSIGRELIAATAQRHLTVDLIVRPDGSTTAFTSLAPLRRLMGCDGSYRVKHKEYIAAEPLLGLVE
jgi:hypothetical protein